MIRFEPDTWVDAVMRPFAMAAPDANVYVEIAAPDLRFACLILLALMVAVCWKKVRTQPSVVPIVLFLFITISFWPWLATSGNGRYYIPILLIAGPVCVGLIRWLPLTRAMQISMVILLISAQVFVLTENQPWRYWGLVQWKDTPYFPITQPPIAAGRDITYVLGPGISFSLLAPQFPPSVRWVGLNAVSERDKIRTREILGEATSIVLLIRASREHMTANKQPTREFVAATNDWLSSSKLAIDQNPCEFMAAPAVMGMDAKNTSAETWSMQQRFGFWLCRMKYPEGRASPLRAAQPPPQTEAVFSKLENICPRFFPRGNGMTEMTQIGAFRHYSESDMKVYVLNDGAVMYKFWRALNPVLVGTVEDVLAGKTGIDCSNIKGRSGLPWERGI